MPIESDQELVQATVPRTRTVVYIDGYNLYYGRLRGTPHKWLDVVALFVDILRMQDSSAELITVKYFSAPALAKFASHGQHSMVAQQSYHRALEALHPDRFSITLGTHSHDRSGTLLPVFDLGKPFDRNKRVRVWMLEEKQTDVNLAMAMYRDTAKGVLDQVVLCSNDSDAEPVLRALREDYPSLRIGIVTPVPPSNGKSAHRGVSAALARHAHWTRRHILDEELARAQLPLRVPTRRKPIDKPPHW
jgi:uncharacterized LabA/DUF88 family protein